MDDARARFARYLLGQADTPPASPRAAVYQRLVWNSYRSVIGAAVPTARALLGDEGFEAALGAFLGAGGPKTSLYRDLPGDFVAWALAAEHPLGDLFHWEWLELVAARHPADLDAWSAGGAPGLAAGVVVPNPTIQLGVYGRPVHLLGAENPAVAPTPEPTVLLVWRRPTTDETETAPVGLLLARALAHAAAAPSSLAALAERVGVEAPTVPRAELEAALEGALAGLAARDGVLR